MDMLELTVLELRVLDKVTFTSADSRVTGALSIDTICRMSS